jgi:hypothetical protein
MNRGFEDDEIPHGTSRISKDHPFGPAGRMAGIPGVGRWHRRIRKLGPRAIYTDEAMSWETVRNLERMPALVLIIRNLCLQSDLSGEVMENLENVTNILEDTLGEFPS